MVLDNKKTLEYSLGNLCFFTEMADNLRESFGIENFGFLRIYFDNQFFYICNNKDLVKDYYSRINRTNIFYNRNLSSKESEYQAILWPNKPENLSMNLYYQYNYWNGITLLKKSHNNEYIDLWWFAASQENTRILDFYINNKDLLCASIKYFSYKYEDVINAPNLAIFSKGIDFSNLQCCDANDGVENNAISFVKKLFPKGFEVRGRNGLVTLTTRELTCLQQIAHGMTAKQIACNLGISFRTVEKFTHSLQIKTGYSFRSDLVLLYYDQVHIFLKVI